MTATYFEFKFLRSCVFTHLSQIFVLRIDLALLKIISESTFNE